MHFSDGHPAGFRIIVVGCTVLDDSRHSSCLKFSVFIEHGPGKTVYIVYILESQKLIIVEISVDLRQIATLDF